jgi:hypothetical protein
MQNNKLPYTPLSNLEYYWKSNSEKLNTPGSPQFKFGYSLRSVLYNKPSISSLEFVTDLFNKHNGSVKSSSALQKDAYELYVSEYINLMKYAKASGFADVPRTDNDKKISKMLKYAEDNKSKDLHNTFKTEFNSGDLPTTDRKSLQVLNIIDLNIVPVNFHALRREIPFVNLFNYAYTFKQIVNKLNINLSNAAANEKVKNLLVNPHTADRLTGSEMKNSNIRFISDYSYLPFLGVHGNKVLLRNMEFLVLAHKVIRDSMQQELEKLESPVVTNLQALDRRITEFKGNENVRDDEFTFINNGVRNNIPPA